jgi:hypothetical protein
MHKRLDNHLSKESREGENVCSLEIRLILLLLHTAVLPHYLPAINRGGGEFAAGRSIRRTRHWPRAWLIRTMHGLMSGRLAVCKTVSTLEWYYYSAGLKGKTTSLSTLSKVSNMSRPSKIALAAQAD